MSTSPLNSLPPLSSLAGILFFAVAGGCAAAYHAYPAGCVPCDYCPAEPLPYVTYHACPTPLSACYEGKVTEDKTDLDSDG